MSFSIPTDRRSADSEERSFDLRGLLAIFRRRWKAIVLPVAMLVVLASAYVATAQRIYSANAVLLIESPVGTNTAANDVNRDPNRKLLTEGSVLEGRAVRKLVEDSIGVDAPKVTATPVGGADTIKLSALSPDPAKAVEAVDTYAKAYIDFRKTKAVEDLSTTSAEVQKRIKKLEDEDALLKPASTLTTVTTLPDVRRAAIAAEITTLKARLTQLELDAALRTGGALLVSPGVPSPGPVSPQSVPIVGAALVLGLALGLALALMRETLNDRLQGRSDVEVVTHSPVLAEVGTFDTVPEDPIGMNNRQTPQAEAFNGLRASMSFLAVEGEIRSLLVTSAMPGEGKSTVAMSLAATYALSGSSVLLIDTDLRRPDVHQRLGLENDKGLSVVLSSGQKYNKFVQAVPHYTNFSVLTSGPIPPNPFELLASDGLAEVIKSALLDFDMVILDCPPVRPVSDVMALVGKVDGVVLVTNSKLSIRSEVAQAVRSLRQVEARIFGVVLNQTKIAAARYLRYE
jgi:polysaccharide biosynthesis transport protein